MHDSFRMTLNGIVRNGILGSWLPSQFSFLLPSRGKHIAQFIVQESSSSALQINLFSENFGRINNYKNKLRISRQLNCEYLFPQKDKIIINPAITPKRNNKSLHETCMYINIHSGVIHVYQFWKDKQIDISIQWHIWP